MLALAPHAFAETNDNAYVNAMDENDIHSVWPGRGGCWRVTPPRRSEQAIIIKRRRCGGHGRRLCLG